MLSKAQIRFLTSLQLKKFRKEHRVFIVEGAKSVEEFVFSSYRVLQVYATQAASAKLPKIPDNIKFFEASEEDFKKISTLNNPQGVLAVVELPKDTLIVDEKDYNNLDLAGNFVIALDEVQDPGNLGTILRIADWFGIQHVFCSHGTADVYNSKVVQASMGSLSRVSVQYGDLLQFVESSRVPVYAAVLDGQSIYETKFESSGILLFGNEGNGISAPLLEKIQIPVTIPKFGSAESLNVGIATAIFCSEIARANMAI